MFRFLVLTAARSGEVRGATWAEVDTDGALWTIPPTRMKAGDEHRVADEVEAAYFRSDLLEKRRDLMQQWANYLEP